MAGGTGGEAVNAGDPIFRASLYDPKARPGRRWSVQAAATVPRLYHSGAILTPDGYVITTGSEMSNIGDVSGPNANANTTCFPLGREICTDPYEYRLERYTPYYLTNGKERPVIVTCPTELTYNSSFYLEIPKGTKVTNVTFIRYATTTHSTNTDQRFVELDILGVNETHLGVRAPINGALAPPGNWMLFILRDGTPSVAKVVHLHSGPQKDVELFYFAVEYKNNVNLSSQAANIGIIVGSVLGGLLLITALVVFSMKYKAKRANNSENDIKNEQVVIAVTNPAGTDDLTKEKVILHVADSVNPVLNSEKNGTPENSDGL
jgi:hypothetical protein